MTERFTGSWVWGLSLACFVLAAATGAYYRFSLVTPLPGVLDNVRHAHSHLMFFSWVTPPLVLLIGRALARRGARPRGFAVAALLAAVGGLATYVPFLMSGYHLTPVGDRLLPISMMASGANGFVWYLAALLYVVAAWRVRRDAPVRLFDAAMALMVASTISIAALAYLGVSGGVERGVMLALVDWFLTLFADGWFGLAILGLAACHAPAQRLARWPIGALAWSLAAAMLARSVGRFANDALGLAWAGPLEGVAAALAALLWLALVAAVWPVAHGRAVAGGSVMAAEQDALPAPLAPTGSALVLRQLALALLAVKGGVELVGALPAFSELFSQAPLRILFLHAFLLGAVSFSVVAAMRSELGPKAFRGAALFAVAVFVMVAALVPLTPLWPRTLAGPWVLRAAAYTSLGPILVAAVALVRLGFRSAGTERPLRSPAAAPGRPAP